MVDKNQITALEAKAMAYEAELRTDAISMFRPTAYQEPFFLSMENEWVIESLVGGGNRCLHGSQKIYDPVLKRHRRVDSIKGEFHVYSRDPATGKQIIAKAGEPFVKGRDRFYKLELSNGETLIVTAQHQLLSAYGDWTSAESQMQPEGHRPPLASTSSEFTSGFFADDGEPSEQQCSADIVTSISSEEMDVDYVWDFTVFQTSNYECAGVLNHNSGKTLSCAVYIAAVIKNRQITFNDGSKHWARPEKWRNEPIKVWCLGYDWKHIGKTLHRVLFKPDLFRIVKDKKTGEWRSWDPNLPDEVPFEKTRPSPSLIRKSDVIPGTMSFFDKKENQIASFEVKHDGTRVEFFPSTGAKPQGDPAHIIFVDEKLEDESWYSELQVRLVDRRGRLLWAAYPGSSPSHTMMAIVERAAAQIGTPKPWSLAFRFKGSDNQYTRSEMRDNVLSTWDDETRKIRDEGQISLGRWLIYPNFNRYVHRLLSSDPAADDPVAAEFRKLGQIPPLWTRYLILDPGTQHPGILFVAVPPSKFGDFIVPYDEIYIPNLNAKQIAEAVAAKTKGQYFEDFIIDPRAARQTPMGFDGRIGENYEKEFRALRLSCSRQGSRFSFGSDNIRGRILRLQGALNIRGCGTPQIRIHGCKNLCEQMEKYRWGKDRFENPTEEPAQYQRVDIVNCLEYLISRDDCGYVRPPLEKRSEMSLAAVTNHIQGLFRPAKKATDDSIPCGPTSFS